MTRHEYVAICHRCMRILSEVGATRGQAEDAAFIHFLATDHRAIVGRQIQPVIHQEAGE